MSTPVVDTPVADTPVVNTPVADTPVADTPNIEHFVKNCLLPNKGKDYKESAVKRITKEFINSLISRDPEYSIISCALQLIQVPNFLHSSDGIFSTIEYKLQNEYEDDLIQAINTDLKHLNINMSDPEGNTNIGST